LIKGIIFDLGSTLIHFTRDWDTVIHEGAEAMTTWYLKKKHIKLDAQALIEAFIAGRAAGRQIAYQTQTEVLTQQTLGDALKKIGAPPTAEVFIEAAIKIYFGPLEAAWQIYPDTIDTIKLLKEQGYRLGLYSNATDDPLVQRLVNTSGCRPWLSPTFSSAGWGWRKPKREPFDLIARRWNLPSEEIVVIGDTLEADILGAQNAGMHSILVTMNEAPSNADNRHIEPAAIANSLSKLPEIIAQL
jgi:putative hydrolase of the HAD superfamily